MIFLLKIFFLFQSLYINYINPEKDYAMEIKSIAHYKRFQSEGGYTDAFTMVNATNLKSIDYIITVSKIQQKQSISPATLFSTVYKTNFVASCNCEVIAEKEEKYTNLTGKMFHIKLKNGGMAGYSYSIVKNNNIYNITLLANETLLNKSNTDYIHMLNSMKVFK